MSFQSSVSPGSTRRENLRFLFFCAALIQAADAAPADVTLDAELEAVLAAIARGEDTGALTLSGKGFALHGPLASHVFEEAIDELTANVRAWTEAGEDLDAAVREVVADSYRRHRANTREYAVN
jgi:glutamine synthetase type III